MLEKRVGRQNRSLMITGYQQNRESGLGQGKERFVGHSLYLIAYSGAKKNITTMDNGINTGSLQFRKSSQVVLLEIMATATPLNAWIPWIVETQMRVCQETECYHAVALIEHPACEYKILIESWIVIRGGRVPALNFGTPIVGMDDQIIAHVYPGVGHQAFPACEKDNITG